MTDAIFMPDAERMLEHIKLMFGDSMADALIELSWTGPRDEDTDVRHAQLFELADYHDLIERAKEINSFKGQNVYIGAAARAMTANRGKRASGADCLFLPALYVDLDDEGMAEAAIEKTKNVRPNFIVTTGKFPHLRRQFWWRLDDPLTDFKKSEAILKAIAEALGGDLHVTDAPRVMRLAGSVAWPKKPGRQTELTELEIVHPYPFSLEALEAIFPVAASKPPQTTTQANLPAATTPRSSLNLPEPAGLRVQDCLQELHRPGHWHRNVLRLVGYWVRNGLSDVEILMFAAALTQPGYTVEQTTRDLQTMINGAREKWDIPDPTSFLPDGPENTPLTADFLDSLNPAMIPVRQWVLGRSLLKGYLSVLVAPPGVGKSTLCLAQAVAIITGKPITGQPVHRQGKVWIYNNEDDTDELKRRLAAVLQHNNIPFSDIRGQLALNSGADRPLVVARTLADGTVVRLPDVEACIEHIQRHQISVLIVDPFIETHECEENSNQQIKLVGQMFREIARRTNCAVLLVHHTAKPPQGSSEGHAGNMNTARGASALIGVSRVIETLFGMSKRDAERHSIRENLRHLYIRLDDAKANLSLASPEAKWFKRVGVVIANTDEVGVLEPVELADAVLTATTSDDIYHEIICALLAQVKEETITLNAAAIRLAWSGHASFSKYRVTTPEGKQKASTTLRNLIEAACRTSIVIVTGEEAAGFMIAEGVRPVTLRRFSRPAAPADLASAPPEFTDDMEEENEF